MLRIIKNKIRIELLSLKIWLKHKTSRPNKNALFIFGFQKSGTSVIANLLAEKTGKSVSIDTRYFWYNYGKKILDGQIKVENHVKQYSYPFSMDIIKEPNTTFFIPQLKEYFNLEKYIFIVRNPFDNIRSILNRLSLPGNLDDIDIDIVHKDWKYIFEESNGKDYISVLAKRWVLANNQPEIINSKNCILVKYEDFNKSKNMIIENLALRAGFKNKYSITDNLNKQFQPKGNSDVDLNEFFGYKNLNKIKLICGKVINDLQY